MCAFILFRRTHFPPPSPLPPLCKGRWCEAPEGLSQTYADYHNPSVCPVSSQLPLLKGAFFVVLAGWKLHP